MHELQEESPKRLWGQYSIHLCYPPLTQVLDCENIFEIGTYLGGTAWLLARNKPNLNIYTLDFEDVAMADKTKFQFTDRNYLEEKHRGTRYSDTPEQSRITQLYGDSATFDYSPLL